MGAKEKRLSIGFSIFLFLCAIINFVHGRAGAAACCFCAGGLFLALSFAGHPKSR